MASEHFRGREPDISSHAPGAIRTADSRPRNWSLAVAPGIAKHDIPGL
jgi:hypothetical protein